MKFRELIQGSQKTLINGIPEKPPIETSLSIPEENFSDPIDLISDDERTVQEEISQPEELLEEPKDDLNNENFDDDFALSPLSDFSLSSEDMEIDTITPEATSIQPSNIYIPNPNRRRPRQSNHVPRIQKPRKMPLNDGSRKSIVTLLTHQVTEEMFALEDQIKEMQLFSCNDCGLDMENFRGLKQHVQETHDFDRYRVCCEVKLKIQPQMLYDHIRWHLDKSAFTCKDCGKKFGSSDILRIHEKSHRPTPSLTHVICEICGAVFLKASRLKMHLLIHETVKCPHCDKGEFFLNKLKHKV